MDEIVKVAQANARNMNFLDAEEVVFSALIKYGVHGNPFWLLKIFPNK